MLAWTLFYFNVPQILDSGWELGHGVGARLGVVELFKLRHLGTPAPTRALGKVRANADVAGHTWRYLWSPMCYPQVGGQKNKQRSETGMATFYKKDRKM